MTPTCFVPVVDPLCDPHTVAAVYLLTNRGWPSQAVMQWAIATSQLSAHFLAVNLTEGRFN